jgi:L-lactate dehydrogenase
MPHAWLGLHLSDWQLAARPMQDGTMKGTVAIIGTGWVGSSVAISSLHSGVADELLVYDLREAVAEGEAMDLAQGASFYPPAVVRTAAIEDMVHADVIVIAAGRGGRPGESRLDLLRESAALIGDIGKRLTRARGTVSSSATQSTSSPNE